MKPTAWYDPSNGMVSTDRDCPLFTPLGQVWPLYPKGEWVGLSDECRKQLIQEGWSDYIAGIDDGKTFGEWMSVATEAKLKEKNT
jgi:hypothetical protein